VPLQLLARTVVEALGQEELESIATRAAIHAMAPT
jgi:hypothetical protein